MSTIKVKVHFSDKRIKKLASQVADTKTLLELHNLLAKMCDPYVPFLNGPLSQTNIVSAHGVRYIQPYARYQYYGVGFNHTKDVHPLASAKWDEAMFRDRGEEFDKQAEDIIKRRAGEII